VETKEELLAQYKHATIRLKQAFEWRNSRLPKGDDISAFTMTSEFIAEENKKIDREIIDAMASQREILEKLWKLRHSD
jgi:hypothetical protein